MRVAFAITFILSCFFVSMNLSAREEFPPLSGARVKGFWLTVSKDGACTGTVTSDVAGINCGSGDDCKRYIREGTIIHLTGTPDGGCALGGWAGDGTGSATRSIIMSQARTVTATFNVTGGTIYAQYDCDSLTWDVPSGTGSFVIHVGNISIDTSEKIEGTGSCKFEVPGNAQGDMTLQGPSAILFDTHNGEWIYMHSWMKFDSGFSFGTADQVYKALRALDPASVQTPPFNVYNRATFLRIEEGPIISTYPSDDRRLFYDFRPEFNNDVTNWQEYIVGIKRQTTFASEDVEFVLYVNGVEIDRKTGLRLEDDLEQWRMGRFVGNWIYPQFNQDAAGGTVWIDDILVTDYFFSNYGQ